MPQYSETLYSGYAQSFEIESLLFDSQTEHQRLVIFDTPTFGRVMALDGIIQTTEKDEFIYHEMLSHVPLIAHGQAKRVLIIGGGDGGMLREVTKHRSVEHITHVEIDRAVVNLCREYLPNHSAGAFDDSRVQLIIDDGLKFVTETDRRFDIIISDSTDPIGPGEALFTQDFYAGCHRCLNPGGILVTQNGVAFMQPEEVAQTAGRLDIAFADWHFFAAAVPTYVGGQMMFAWGSDEAAYRQLPVKTIASRFEEAKLETRYYTPQVHVGSFALPRYVERLIGKRV